MAGRNATKADVILKDFWRQNERFADLFNAVIFHGKQVIKPEDLTERDTDMSGIIQFKGYQETLERTRDVVKKMAYGVEFAVLGIESQQKIHYAMPLRTMLYDSLGYLKEYQEITGLFCRLSNWKFCFSNISIFFQVITFKNIFICILPLPSGTIKL